MLNSYLTSLLHSDVGWVELLRVVAVTLLSGVAVLTTRAVGSHR
jgi:hypothetical protein